MFKDILYVAISLIGVLGLFFMVAWGLRKLSGRVSFASSGGSRLRILDRVNLGRDSMLLVVSVCDKLMLIGVSGQNTQKLADLDMSEDEYLNAAKTANSGGAGFFDVFGGILNKNGKNKKSEEENDEDEGNA